MSGGQFAGVRDGAGRVASRLHLLHGGRKEEGEENTVGSTPTPYVTELADCSSQQALETKKSG